MPHRLTIVKTLGDALVRWASAGKAGGGKLRAVPQACFQAGGAVTGLCVANDCSCVVAAVSTESRLGRWYKSEGSKNGIYILPFNSD